METHYQHNESEEKLLHRFDDVLDGYRDKPGALIPALQAAQNMFGYLPMPAMKMISEKLDTSMSKVLGVVTFYSFFSTVPRGKYVIRVCLGTTSGEGSGSTGIGGAKSCVGGGESADTGGD